MPRWERQIATTYAELSEKEKESDREQVRPYLPLIRKIEQSAITRTAQSLLAEIEGKWPKKKRGRHDFWVGTNNCHLCGEPRIIVDRKRTLLSVDEKSGGTLAEVSEKQIDQTEFTCTKSPLYSGYNTALTDALAVVKEVLLGQNTQGI